MISITVKGSFIHFDTFAARMKRREQFAALGNYGALGVKALARYTPKDSGDTANAWSYEIASKPGYFAVHWYNSHSEEQVPIVILLQYGHGTRSGGYVHGIDFVNPALRSIFTQMANEMWKVVTK